MLPENDSLKELQQWIPLHRYLGHTSTVLKSHQAGKVTSSPWYDFYELIRLNPSACIPSCEFLTTVTPVNYRDCTSQGIPSPSDWLRPWRSAFEQSDRLSCGTSRGRSQTALLRRCPPIYGHIWPVWKWDVPPWQLKWWDFGGRWR